MIVVIAGTNRPDSNTLKVARIVADQVRELEREPYLIDLATLPSTVFGPSSYAERPQAIAVHQAAILRAAGIVTVVPEYNGSYPGALKYFIDLLEFPESFADRPAAFVGIAAGEGAGVRAVEHLEMVFQYRRAHLYGRRVFIKRVHRLLDDEHRLADPELMIRLRALVQGFIGFSECLHQVQRDLEAGRTP